MRLMPLVVALCMIIVALAGCGSGTGSGSHLRGTLEGNVFVPSSRSGAGTAYLTMDRSGAPTGYEPLVNATVTVTIAGGSYTTITDVNGRFIISGLPAGTAAVKITPLAGSAFREFTTSANIVSGSHSAIGQDGNISLISGAATSLGVTINSVDISAWPIVRVYVSVLDPKANAAIIGMSSSNFSLKLNDAAVSGVGVSTEMTTGSDPRQVYVLTATMTGAKAALVRADLSATYCGRTGSATGSSATATPFLSPMAKMTVSNSFKDLDYAAHHAGKWHMGADIPAAVDTHVNAVAKGQVVGVYLSGMLSRVIVRHHLSSDMSIAGGKTRDIYVVYGCITPSVVNGAVVEAGQLIGTVHLHGSDPHLHIGVRVGQTISTAWDDGNLVGGLIPAADTFGLTDGWVDPITFFAQKSPDNS